MAAQLLNNWRSCRAKCRSQQHVDDIARAVSKVPEEMSQLYLLAHCSSAWRRVDGGGRSLVHWAASRGLSDLLDWLIGRLKATFTERYEANLTGGPFDNEGLSVLELIRLDMRCGDYALQEPTELFSFGENNSFNLGHSHPSRRNQAEPVDSLRRAGLRPIAVSMSKFHTLVLCGGGEAFACGHGLGGRLGLANEEPAFSPQRVFLGPPDATTSVAALFAARNHSLFLDSKGNAYSCGVNDYRQLGLGRDVRDSAVLQPTLMPFPKHWKDRRALIGCAGSSFHSVVWSEEAVLVCGLNAGQLGLGREEGGIVHALKQTSFAFRKEGDSWTIKSVATSEAALAIATSKGEVYLMTGWERIRVASRLVGILSVHVLGGHLKPLPDGDYGGCKDHEGLPSTPIRVVILTSAGHLFHWHEEDKMTRRVVYTGAPRSSVFPTSVQLYKRGLLLTLPDGRALRGTFRTAAEAKAAAHKEAARLRKKSGGVFGESTKEFAFSSGDFLDPTKCQVVSLTRVANVHRAILSACDPAGNNFAFVLQDPATNLTEIPQIRASEMVQDFATLFTQAEMGDNVHDLVIYTDKRQWILHKFVVFSRCSGLRKVIENDCSVPEDGSALRFRWPASLCESDLILGELLEFLYTDSSSLLRPTSLWHLQRGPLNSGDPGPAPLSAKKKKKKVSDAGPNVKLRGKLPHRQLGELAKKLGLTTLAKRAESLTWEPLDRNGQGDCEWVEVGRVAQSAGARTPAGTRLRFEPTVLPSLADVAIRCADGKTLLAHK